MIVLLMIFVQYNSNNHNFVTVDVVRHLVNSWKSGQACGTDGVAAKLSCRVGIY